MKKLLYGLQNNITYILLCSLLVTLLLNNLINSFLLVVAFLCTLIGLKKKHFSINHSIILLIVLFLIMLLSSTWSINPQETTKAIIKELPLIIISLVVLLNKKITEFERNKIIKYYSYSIVLFSIYFIVRALIKYFSSDSNLFFSHELVTKELNAVHFSVFVSFSLFYFITQEVKTIKTIFILNKNIIDSIGMTSKIAQYYAIWINKSRSSQLLQREELDNKFYLLCFVYYQYLIRNDNLIDRFISVIQSFKTSLLREHKEFVYENVEEKNKTIQSYKELILQILDDIDNCADNSTLDAINRIHQIKQYIYEQRELLNQKYNESSIINENKSKFDLIESKSRSLQGKLSGIIKAIE